ncbi:RNA polymerase sigma factor [Luteimonas sp. RC10]|uniref:RNA polymerase sigma factor n=1 Tax=Luteimonas sp. RC10 TaxID=2587035 RepID=UPI00161EF6CD|nr:RNA polymerase sigma factor [Luteimonas sp. RC10]MBB3344059.1 RNA polymerase sigma factor (sigma-70 family) [Luteimonas sp. RC10]
MSAIAADPSLEDRIHLELPAARDGDQAAYGRIVRLSQNATTAIALAITRDVQASQDIAQEAYLKAWQQLGRLQNPTSFLPWLRQITRNLARDHLRARRDRLVAGEVADLAIAQAADPDSCPMQRIIDDESGRVAADLISELPDDSREVLLLYYREGGNSRQVAALLGLSDAAVRKRLSRARRSLREDLIARFRDFAEGSAPGTAFTVLVVAGLGSFTKPALAAGAAGGTIGSGVAGKALFGSAGAAGASLVFGALTWWLCRKLLLQYTDTDDERRALLRFYDRWMLASVIGGAFVGLAYAVSGNSYTAFCIATVTLLVAITLPALTRLPRLMNPLLARDAARDPAGARRRARIYELTFGRTGMLLGNLMVIGMLVIIGLRGH